MVIMNLSMKLFYKTVQFLIKLYIGEHHALIVIIFSNYWKIFYFNFIVAIVNPKITIMLTGLYNF